jgi:1-acyl-sn-glycerol-3-phosphate acyltransferase
MTRVEPLTDGAPLALPFGEREIAIMRAVLAPLRAVAAPRVFGLEHLPAEGPVLLVGNHTVFGMIDAPLMALAIIEHTGRVPRGLAEHAHYRLPGWRDLLTWGGAVRGTRDNCRALFAAGEMVLVYPGGGREVAKRKGEKYQLIWKERTGFARMAIESGVPIVPFSAIGVEEMVDIVVDADHAALRPVRSLVERLGGRWELVWPPVVRGLGPTPLPRPQRFYFAFGAPIRTRQRTLDDASVRALRHEVERAVLDGIDFLQAARDTDPRRTLRARLFARD